MVKRSQKGLALMSQGVLMGLAVIMTGCNTTLNEDQFVDELYQKMPQEERIAQLKSMYMDELFDADGKLDTAKCKKLIPNGI